MAKKILFLLVMILALSVCASAYGAETLIVKLNPAPESYDEDGNRVAPFEFATLKDALDFANYPSVVENEEDFKRVSIDLQIEDTLDSTITLSDYSNIERLTISGNTINAPSEGRHFIIDTTDINFTLRNLTIKGSGNGGILINNGKAAFNNVVFTVTTVSDGDTDEELSEDDTKNGGAVRIDGSSSEATFTNCTFRDCSAYNGGAVYIVDGKEITFSSGTKFENNKATNYGGAVAVNVTGSFVPEFNGVNFTRNSAVNGGAVVVLAGNAVFLSSQFNNNSAENGGAVYPASRARATINGGTEFNSNTATLGGAVYIPENTTVEINGESIVFDANKANEKGGAVYIEGTNTARLSITGDNSVTFTNNNAESSGGAIYADANGRMNFEPEVIFSNNSVTNGNGGALTVYYASSLPEGTLTFTGNTANGSDTDTGNGGAIYVEDYDSNNVSSVKLGSASGFNYSFANNRAEKFGGAIYSVSADITVDGLTVSERNNAGEGGGFLSSAAGNISISNSSISNQTAKNGGAVYIDAQTLTINDVYFDSNTADQLGGAICINGEGETTITTSTFAANQGQYGGAIRVFGEIRIDHSYFVGNSASSRGGAIAFTQSGTGGAGVFDVETSTFEGNVSRGDRGGALSLAVNIANIKRCTFNGNHITGSEGQGGAVYLDLSGTNTSSTQYVENCTFVANDVTNGSGGALYVAGTVTIRSNTFTLNNSASVSGGALFVSGGEITILGNILVGNSAPQGGDVWSDSGSYLKPNGFNRVGNYGTAGAAVSSWIEIPAGTGDRENRNWSTETFFGTNAQLADNISPDDDTKPPYIGSTLSDYGQIRLQTMMLSEDANLDDQDRATNIIPYATYRYNFPQLDERGVDRWGGGTSTSNHPNLDIGAVYFDGARAGANPNDGPVYDIASIIMSGVPNTLRSIGQTASLIALVRYSNGRTAYGGNGEGEEPVTWSSSNNNIISIDQKGVIVALNQTPNNSYVTISVRTNRVDSNGNYVSASQPVRVTGQYSSMNVSTTWQNYYRNYIREVNEYDISLMLLDDSASASNVKASVFQRNFKNIWSANSVSQVTDLSNPSLTLSTAKGYRTSDGLVAAKTAGVNLNFQNRSEGDLFPLIYIWDFSGEELKSLLGYDLLQKSISASLADDIFKALRIDFQTSTTAHTVVGSGGVSGKDAFSNGALNITKADAQRGAHIELTAYLANVKSSGNDDGPQFVKSYGTTRLLVVPDGFEDGAISGTMWMAGKASSSNTNTDSNNPSSSSPNSNTNNNSGSSEGSGEGGGGGGGCNSLGLGLLGAFVVFMIKRK